MCRPRTTRAALAIVNIIRNGGGDTYDMEMYYSANPEGQGQGQGEGERAHTGSDRRAIQCYLILFFPLVTSYYCLHQYLFSLSLSLTPITINH